MPLPEPLQVRAGARVRVTASSLNVRSRPSTSEPIIARLPGGAVVETARPSDRDWVEVHVGARVTGWVSTAYLAIVDEAQELAEAPTMPTVDMVTGESWVIPWETVTRMPETVLRCPRCTLVSCAGDCP